MNTQKADTRKTTSLLKKYLKEQFGITFKIKTSKYNMGCSMDITYIGGVDEKTVYSIVSKLQYGYFNGMEDIYEHIDNAGLVIDGYQLEEWKYISVHQKLPDTLVYAMAKCMSDKWSYADVKKLETFEQLDERFKRWFGKAYSWRGMINCNLRERNFVTDDCENIKILDVEQDNDTFSNYIFTYEYNGKTYNTKSLEPIEIEVENKLEKTNINQNTTEMKKVVYQEMQKVKVEYKNGKTFEGTIIKAGEKSITVQTPDEKKVVMFITGAKITLLDDNKKETKAETPKEHPATTKAKKETSSTKNATKYEEPLTEEETKLAAAQKRKQAAKAKKEDSKDDKKETTPETTKNKAELSPIMEMLSKVVDKKTFDSVVAEVAKTKTIFVGVKDGEVEYILQKFEKNNIYVTNTKNEKTYFSLPRRFPVHFAIKE